MKTNRLRTIWTVILAVFLISMQVAIIAFAKEDDYIFPTMGRTRYTPGMEENLNLSN